MKKLLTICAFVAVALSFTGCVGFSSLTATNHNLTQTQVVLSDNNFEVVGQAHGDATATYICGFCAVSKKALRNNAINEMTKKCESRWSTDSYQCYCKFFYSHDYSALYADYI